MPSQIEVFAKFSISVFREINCSSLERGSEFSSHCVESINKQSGIKKYLNVIVSLKCYLSENYWNDHQYLCFFFQILIPMNPLYQLNIYFAINPWIHIEIIQSSQNWMKRKLYHRPWQPPGPSHFTYHQGTLGRSLVATEDQLTGCWSALWAPFMLADKKCFMPSLTCEY